MVQKTDNDSQLDLSEADYKKKFEDIQRREESGDFNNIVNNYDKPGDDSQDKTRQAEQDGSPPGNWTNSTSPSGGKVLSSKNAQALLKRYGPMGIIAAVGLGGGLIATLLFTPGLLLVQMKEALVDRFNYQLTSMDARSTAVLNSKITKSVTSGICGQKVSIGCKLSTISEKQAARLERAGITIQDGAEKFGDRIKPGALVFKNNVIPANEVAGLLRTDPEFRSAMHVAYNPKLAGFTDSIWTKVADDIGISKGRALPDGSAADKAAAIDEKVKNGAKLSIPDDGVRCTDTCRDKDGTKLPPEDQAAARAAAEATQEAAAEAADEAEQAATKSLSKVAGGATDVVGNFLKVTGVADMGCQAYTAVRSLGFAAKTVRAFQLARYAMVFLNTADQIMAGKANSEDVAYLGTVLTSLAIDVKAGVQRKAAMDSFGMQYAMYGRVGKADSYVSQFMAGGGLTGDLITITDFIGNSVGGVPKDTCKNLSNGWVQAGSLAAGIALLLIPGVNVAISFGDVVKGVGAATLSVALTVLPDLLKDIIAGNVTKGVMGEDAGNGIASGAGTLMSTLAQAGGNAPLTVDQAVAYTSTQDETLARYAEEDRQNLSPLDASNKNTFLGSIVSKLLPYQSQFASIGGSLSSVASLVTGSFASLIPSAHAVTTAQYEEAYTSCTDEDIVALKLASDPFCNAVFGIPVQYLNKDPLLVVAELQAAGDLTTSGKPKANYASFIKSCIERDAPLGDAQNSSSGDDGSICTVTSDLEADYYLNYVDDRVDRGMDGYDTQVTTEVSDKQALAQEIVDSPNVTYYNGDNGVGPDGNVISIKEQIAAIANGDSDGNTAPCQVNIAILQIVAALAKDHTIDISDINRNCVNSNLHTTSSPHWTGNAIDIDRFDGTNSSSDKIKELMDVAIQYMPAGSKFGIVSGCKAGGIGSNYKGFLVFDDPGSCGHIHIGMPLDSDPEYK